MKLTDNIDIQNSRILIVDDDATTRLVLRRILEQCGYSVDEVASGEAAMEKITEQEPDLILLDVMMDGIDGFVTCEKIKAIDGMDEVPVVFVTGRSDTNSIVKGLDAGGSDYITKPINRHEAVARIKNHLEMRMLMRLQREFIDGLKRNNLAKNRVIGVASHDLRNPLASIRGLSEFLSVAGPLNDDQKEIASTIQSTSTSMLQLVDELLDLSVIESGEERSEREPCKIVEVLSSSVSIYQFSAQKKGIEVEFQDHGLPKELMLDKMQFRRLVDNLLSNAIKYSPPDTKVSLIAERHGDELLLHIQDEGPGIPESEVHKLFTDFGKTSVKPTGNETSTGLGLAICKKIAETHKGTVTFKNRTDRSGSIFTIHLSMKALSVPEV